jgi:FtsP/CotA-like multicopper oxidase with cupredoxin domain
MQGFSLITILVSVNFANAVTFNLCTSSITKTMPDGNMVTMWGYALDTAVPPILDCTAVVPGPRLTVPDGDTVLTINLRNTLAETTSIIIPGLTSPTPPVPAFITDSQGRIRHTSMTHEAAANGGIATYAFNATPGTYLYQSGSHPAVQVQMGLYGAVTNDTLIGEAYPSVTYDNEVLLLYSEIDPGLHTAVTDGTYGDKNILNNPYLSTINYQPKYFLVNGAPYTASTLDIPAGVTGETTLIRFLNAGLESHAPVLMGDTMDILGEYGSPYPYKRKQYSFELVAGQSRDALFSPTIAKRYALFDRRLRLTNNMQSEGGLMSFLSVTARVGAPIAVIDSATTDEDTVITALNLAGNDTDDGVIDLDSIHIPFQPENGTVVINNNGTGTVSYTPNANFHGIDTFIYTIRDTDAIPGNISNAAEVTITVNSINNIPIANDNSYFVIAGTTLNIPTLGVLDNDTDADLDALTVAVVNNVTGGALALNTDGSFSYTPNFGSTTDTFTYVANDGTANSNQATVSINIEPLLAATLTSPTGDIEATPPPIFEWEVVAGATDYRLWLRNDSTNTILIDQLYTATQVNCNTTTCSLPTPVALTDGNYRWLIRSKNTFWGWNCTNVSCWRH